MWLWWKIETHTLSPLSGTVKMIPLNLPSNHITNYDYGELEGIKCKIFGCLLFTPEVINQCLTVNLRGSCSPALWFKHTLPTLTSSPWVSSSALRRSWRIWGRARRIPATMCCKGTSCPQTVSCSGGTGLSGAHSLAPETSRHCGSVLDPSRGPTGSSACKPCLWHKCAPPSWARGVKIVGSAVTFCWDDCTVWCKYYLLIIIMSNLLEWF